MKKELKGKKLEQSMDFIASLNYEWQDLSMDLIRDTFFAKDNNTYSYIGILVTKGLIEKRKGSFTDKKTTNRNGKVVKQRSTNSYRLANPSNPPSIQKDIDLPSIVEEEFFGDQQVADLVVYEGLFPDITNKFHSKYKTQVAEIIRITDKDILLYKESKAWVENEYFGFDADAQRKRCLDLGMSESKVNFLIAKTLENGSVQQKV